MTDDSDPTANELAEALHARFDAIDARLDLIDGRLAGHSESLAWIKMNIGMLSQATAAVAASVEQCRLELAKRDTRMDQLEAAITRLSDSVDAPEGTA